MKRILSIILTAAMLFSMIAVSVSANIDHADVTNESKNVFSAELSTQDTLMPGDAFTLKVAADSFWGDQDLVTDDIDLGEVTGAYGPAIFTVSAVFDTSAILASKAPTLATDSTIGNGEYMSATMPTKAVMNRDGVGTVVVSSSQVINDDEDGYITFYGSGDVVTFNFEIAEDALPGTYYIYIGDYRSANESKYDEIIDGKYISYSPAVDPYATKLDRSLSQYPDAIAITVGSNASEDDLAAAANVSALIANIGTVAYKSTFTSDVQYAHIDGINKDGYYMHVNPWDSPYYGSEGTFIFEIEFYASDASVNGYGFIGGVTSTDGGENSEARCFYNPGTKTFMIAATDSWMNSSSVSKLYAESDVIECVDGEFLTARYIYNGSNLSIECNGEVVCSASDVPTNYNFFIFYTSKADYYIKSITVTDTYIDDEGNVQVNENANNTFDGTNLSAIQEVLGSTHEGLTSKTFSYYADSAEKIAAAEAAYAALTDLQKALVSGADTLAAARAEYDALAAAATDALIEAIGTVRFNPNDATKDSNAAITAAEEAYAALTDAQKELVVNYETLTAARARWNQLFDLNDQAYAADVDALILAIGEVNFNSRAAIDAARAAYEALTDSQKAYVTELPTLVAAEETYAIYGPIMEVETAINAIGNIVYADAIYREFGNPHGYIELHNDSDENDGAPRAFNFDFLYTEKSFEGSKHANVGFMNSDGYYVGFDLTTNKAIIGTGGGWGNITDDNPIVSVDYELVANTWYNITLERDGSVLAVSVNGEQLLSYDCGSTDYSWYIFYPQYVKAYFANTVIYNNGVANETLFYDTAVGNYGDPQWSPTVTVTSWPIVDPYSPADIVAKIVKAEALYNALTDEQKQYLAAEYVEILEAARAQVDAIDVELKAAAAEVDVLIAAIETLADADAAQAAYDALPGGAKQFVTLYDDLANANVTFVENEIAALGEITLDSIDAIVAAEASFAALSADQQALVSNYDVLVAARDAYSALRAAEVDAIIDALGEITLDSADAVAAAEAAYNGLSNAERIFVTKYDVLVAAKEKLVSLKLGHGNVTRLIESLFYGGTGINHHFAGNGYTQLANNPGSAEFTFAYAMMNPVAQAEGTSHTIGGGVDNGLWAGYDVDRQAFVVYKDFNLFGDGEWSDGMVLASCPMTLEADTWYFVELTFSSSHVAIAVDNTEILRVDVGHDGDTWFIYYPRNIECSFDAFLYTLNDEILECTTEWSDSSLSANWTVGVGNDWSVATDLPEAVACQARIEAVYAAYNLLTEDQKATIENADKLLALVAPQDPADQTQEKIDALESLDKVDLDNQTILENIDTIADAYNAYNSLTEDEQAEVDATALFAALEEANKALVYDAVLNNNYVAPTITAVGIEDAITVSWDAVDNAACYWVYVDDVVVLRTTETSATIAATAGEHTVKVQVAINENADTLGAYGAIVSGTSDAVNVTVIEGWRFTASVDTTDTEAYVTWNAYEGASLYYVKAITAEGAEIATFKIADVTVLEKVLPKLSYEYYVEVLAYVDGAFVSTPTVYVEALNG